MKHDEQYIRAQLDRVNAITSDRQNQDQYNTDNYMDITQYKNLLKNSSEKYKIRDGETLKQFTSRIELHIDIGLEKNERIHITPPKGAWYQHRNPAGCFCCEDQNMIHYLLNVLMLVSHKYPTFILQ